MKKRSLIAATSAMLLLTTACGSSNAPQAAQAEGNKEITVAAMPISNTAPIWLGKEKGFFEAEGLDLTIEPVAGGADIPGVVSGNYDFAFGNVMSVFVAKEKGLDLRFVSNAASANNSVDSDSGAVIAPEGSDIKTASDLAGKKVSVNNLNNIGDTTIRSAVEAAGGDPKSIEFVEIDFPNVAAALETKQVEAGWVTEPFMTTAIADGAHVVSYNFKETHPQLDIAGYFTKGEVIEQDPELVKSFQAAMKTSLEYAQKNPDEVRDIIATYTKMDAAVLDKIILPDFRPDFDKKALTVLGDSAVKYGTLKQAPNLEELLP
jgi:NitT/TauT family transport system substrate-binding protein